MSPMLKATNPCLSHVTRHTRLVVPALVLLLAYNQPTNSQEDVPIAQQYNRQVIEVPAAQRKVQPHSKTPAINTMGAQCSAKIGVIEPFLA